MAAFLADQRADRLRRLREIVERLRCSAAPSTSSRCSPAAARSPGRSVGRPLIADALVAAGLAQTGTMRSTACSGTRAPRTCLEAARRPTRSSRSVHRAGGLVSLAHPGVTRMDAIIPRLAGAGLAALEARHSDHDTETEQRYRDIAARHAASRSRVVLTFTATSGHRIGTLGALTLPADDLAALEARRRMNDAHLRSSRSHAVAKSYGGLRPLRIRSLAVAPGERVAIAGIDAAGAEVMVNLVTGARCRTKAKSGSSARRRRTSPTATSGSPRSTATASSPTVRSARGVDARAEPCAAVHAGDRSGQSRDAASGGAGSPKNAISSRRGSDQPAVTLPAAGARAHAPGARPRARTGSFC